MTMKPAGDRESLVNPPTSPKSSSWILRRDERRHDGGAPEPSQIRRSGRASRLAVDRPGRGLGAVVADEFFSGHGPRVEQPARRRSSPSPTVRSTAASTACRSRRPWRGRSRLSACRRASSRSVFGDLRRGIRAPGGDPPAGKGHVALRRRVSARRTAADDQARGHRRAHPAGYLRAKSMLAVIFRLPVRYASRCWESLRS